MGLVGSQAHLFFLATPEKLEQSKSIRINPPHPPPLGGTGKRLYYEGLAFLICLKL
ncbi:hypothetical protein D082_13040 [Synechocystis sp. PCC 6714]|nr:hypothetical protein D082_13040 [Synechocystis sp. PCC 6714]